MSDKRKPSDERRKPESRVRPSGYFRGETPNRRAADQGAADRQQADDRRAADREGEDRLSADRVGEEKRTASGLDERASDRQVDRQLPPEERGQAKRTMHSVDAVRDDPHAQAIPQGEPSGTTATLHETSDVGLKILIAVGGIVGGLVIVALIVVRVLTSAFYSSPETQPQGGSAIETAAPPAAVEMRANPLPAWQRYRATADAELNGYGWVNQDAGVARIPIERALSLLTEGVLPMTGVEGTPAPTATPTP